MAINPKDFERVARDLPIGRDPASVRRRIVAVEAVLERAFAVPGTSRRIGLDAILGLVPVIGDLIAAALGAWMIWEARNLGMSKFHIARMTGNIAFDTVVGAVPLLGDAFDVLFRSNTRNVRIVKRWLDKHHPEAPTIEGEVLERREV
jgi:hypothetical protein